MQYVKKMCILRQVKQGFSGDGKALSGLVKAEQYGKNLAVEVSVINFAPLSSGEYYCVLSDSLNRTEMLPLRNKSLFNILTDMDISGGFCAVVCFVKNDVIPIAYGVNGDKRYDWKNILAATLPPTFSEKSPPPQKTELPVDRDDADTAVAEETPVTAQADGERKENDYDDETLANENYYKEAQRGQELLQEVGENARAQSAGEEQDKKTGADTAQDAYAENVLSTLATNPDGYYLTIKREMDTLLAQYPKDDTLCGAFSCSEWVRVKGTAENPQYLVGVVYEDGKARYICYALAAEDRENPPAEIKDVCAFVPSSPFDGDNGFFVIFQSATTGECIKPTRA